MENKVSFTPKASCSNRLDYNKDCGEWPIGTDNRWGVDTPQGGAWTVGNTCAPAGSGARYYTCPCNGEWQSGQSQISGCTYNSEAPLGVDPGCVLSSSEPPYYPVAGRPLECTRLNYSASAAECCAASPSPFSNQGNKTIDNITQYQNPPGVSQGTSATCNPNYNDWSWSTTDPASPKCDLVMKNYCSAPGNSSLWASGPYFDQPNPGDCYRYATTSGNPDVGNAVAAAIQAYFTGPNALTPNEDSHRTPLVSTFAKLAASHPVETSTVLPGICQTYTYEDLETAVKTRETSQASQNLLAMCGCYLPSSQYKKYFEVLEVQCDPMCMMPDAIPVVQNLQPVRCERSACIIDNVTIDIINSSTGGIGFDQACGGCGGSSGAGGGCMCYISGVNINVDGSAIGNLNLKQNCGQCYTYDKNSTPQPVDCSTFAGVNVNNSGNQNSTGAWGWIKQNPVYFGLGSVFLVCVVMLIAYFIYKESE